MRVCVCVCMYVYVYMHHQLLLVMYVLGTAPTHPHVLGTAPTHPHVLGTAPTHPHVLGTAPTHPHVLGTAPTHPHVLGLPLPTLMCGDCPHPPSCGGGYQPCLPLLQVLQFQRPTMSHVCSLSRDIYVRHKTIHDTVKVSPVCVCSHDR